MQVELTNSDLVAIVDDEDYERVRQFNWFLCPNGWGKFYVKCTSHVVEHRFLHSFVLGRTGLDHIDGDPLNNLRSNLRDATPSQNAANSRKREGASSRYRGVSFDKQTNRWRAVVQFEGKRYNCGRHDTEEEAAAAYALKAREIHGEFARL